jgi:predicted GIY-YIG superfamily endonuclease
MIYIIHFSRSLHHARHYLGYSDEQRIRARMMLHRAGRGAKLLAALRRAAIDWVVVRTMEGDRRRERQLKNHHNTPRLCPVCCGRVAWPLTEEAYAVLQLPDVLNPTISASQLADDGRRRGREAYAKLREAQPPALTPEEQRARKLADLEKLREREARRHTRRLTLAARKATGPMATGGRRPPG